METSTRTCSRCAQPLEAAAPGPFCPVCDKAIAKISDTQSRAPAVKSTPPTPPAGSPPAAKVTPPPGSSPPPGAPPAAATASTAPSVKGKDMKDLLPASIGGHEIVGILGSGGMGKVYLARETALGREVALKVLKRDVGELLPMQSLLDEAVVTGKLGHPGIVPIYQVGKDAQFGLWYSMKVVEGVSLTDILTGLRDETPRIVERYTLPALLEIFRRTCDAVAFAHYHGVVNRDLKPGNIMIGEFGEVLVMDWGMARIVNKERESKTFAAAGEAVIGEQAQDLQKRSEVRLIKGTPGYMSPEQAMAKPAGPASDVYALGAILYQILTLRLPVDGRTVQELITKTVAGQVIPPEKRAGVRGLPKALCQLAMKALSLEPRQRFPDARAFAHEVEAYLDGRMPWQSREEGWQSTSGAWDTQEGRLRCGAGVKSKIFHRGRLGGDVRFSATLQPLKDRAATDAVISVALPSTASQDGYQFRFVTGDRGRVEFLRNGALVARRLDFALDAGAEHAVQIVREGPRVRLTVDGKLAFDHREVFPMRGDRLAVSSETSGVALAKVAVESHGPPLQLDFLALPDKVLAIGQLAEARLLYRDMAEAHAERAEGILARFKAAQCSIEMGEAAEAQADLKLLEGSGYEALGVLGQAKLKQKEGKGKEMWSVLLAGLEKSRNDPARLELRAMINGILDQTEREAPAAARDLYLQLIGVPGLMPQETSQVCAEFLRLAAAGGPEKVRSEAMALLEANKHRIELRMECHAALARLDLPKEAAPAARSQIEKTLGLGEVLGGDDRVRLVLWLTASHLETGSIAEAETVLASVAAALEPASPAALRLRQWRTLLSCAQGKWPDAQKLLGADAPPNFLGALLAGLVAGAGSNAAKAVAVVQALSEKSADWKTAGQAVAGSTPVATLVAWIGAQPTDLQAPLAVATAMLVSLRGDKASAETLRARAVSEKSGKALIDWMMRNKRWV